MISLIIDSYYIKTKESKTYLLDKIVKITCLEIE